MSYGPGPKPTSGASFLSPKLKEEIVASSPDDSDTENPVHQLLSAHAKRQSESLISQRLDIHARIRSRLNHTR